MQSETKCPHCGVVRDADRCNADPYINAEPRTYCSLAQPEEVMSEQKYLVSVQALCTSPDTSADVVGEITAVVTASELSEFGKLKDVAEALLEGVMEVPLPGIRAMTDDEIVSWREDHEGTCG